MDTSLDSRAAGLTVPPPSQHRVIRRAHLGREYRLLLCLPAARQGPLGIQAQAMRRAQVVSSCLNRCHDRRCDSHPYIRIENKASRGSSCHFCRNVVSTPHCLPREDTEHRIVTSNGDRRLRLPQSPAQAAVAEASNQKITESDRLYRLYWPQALLVTHQVQPWALGRSLDGVGCSFQEGVEAEALR